jgi:Tfp pilus assembly protein PilN
MEKNPLIKIIPKPKPETPFYVNLLFWVALILIPLLGGGYLYLNSKLSSLQDKKVQLESELSYTKEEKKLEEEVSKTALAIRDFANLLEEHLFPSKFFEFLNSISHPKVQFLSLQLDNEIYQATLSGKADNFKKLGEQILILKKNENIKGLTLYNIFLDREGKVNFSLSFNFDENLVKNKKKKKQ